MSNTMLFLIMGGIEAILILAVLTVILYRSKNEKINTLQTKLSQLKRKSLRAVESSQPSWDQLLQKHISETQTYLSEADQEQQAPLQKRIEFLESELTAQESGVNRDLNYWQSHCSRISLLVPTTEVEDQDPQIGLAVLDAVSDNEIEVEPEANETTNEDKEDVEDEEDEEYDRSNNLDDTISADLSKAMEELAAFDTDTNEPDVSNEEPESRQDIDELLDNATAEDSSQNDLADPAAEDQPESNDEESLESPTDADDIDHIDRPEELLAEDPQQPNEAEEQLTTELKELQDTLAEKDSELVTLKSSLADKDSELTRFDELTEKLKQTELAHQQLNSCIADLEKDNSELQVELETRLPPQEATLEDEDKIDPQEFERISSEISLAQIRIESLHEDLNEKETQITNYRQEIEQLQQEIQKHETEQEKHNYAYSNALSKLEIIDDSDNPEILTNQIEELTNIVVKKSEQLSSLQIEDISEDSDSADIESNSPSPASNDTIPELNDVSLTEMEPDSSIVPNDISQSMQDLLNSKNIDSQDDETVPPTLTKNSAI